MTLDEYRKRVAEVGDMSMLPKLPRVLQQPAENSLSVERVLRKAYELIEKYSPAEDNEANVCLEDLDTMIEQIG